MSEVEFDRLLDAVGATDYPFTDDIMTHSQSFDEPPKAANDNGFLLADGAVSRRLVPRRLLSGPDRSCFGLFDHRYKI